MGKSNDGVEKVGPGRYQVRLLHRNKDTGKRDIDTIRVIDASSKLDAMEKRKKLLQDELDRLYPKPKTWDVATALDGYLKTLRGGTRQTRSSHGNKIRAAFGSRALTDVRPDEIQKWLVSFDIEEGTAKSLRSTFIAVYRHATLKGEYSGHCPVLNTVTPRRPKTSAELLAEMEQKKPRAYVDNQLQDFLLLLEQRCRPLYTLQLIQLLLACRFGEASALYRTDLRLPRVEIRRSQYQGELGPPKGGRPRVTALGPFGVQVLLEHLREMEDCQWPGWETLVFPRPPFDEGKRTHDMWAYKTANSIIKEVRQTLGLAKGVNTHAMRHTYVTQARALQDDATLMQLVGHRYLRQTDDYSDGTSHIQTPAGFAAGVEAALPLPNKVGGLVGAGTEQPPESR